MGYAGEELNPGNQPKGIHVHQALEEEHGQDDQSEVPSFWCIVGVFQLHHTLQHDASNVDDAGFERDPAEPGHPSCVESAGILIGSGHLTLNPSN